MNEQILEYAEQARLYAKSVFPRSIDDPTGWHYEYHKKFAELIVRECASIDFYKLAHIGTEDDYNVTQAIKAHFGVEE